MRQGQQNRRNRGRNRKQQNPLGRNYESNGPDVKIRGTAQHVAEKYNSLARDMLASGDLISAENYFQHAEHYTRIIMAAQTQSQSQSQNASADKDNDAGDDAEGKASEANSENAEANASSGGDNNSGSQSGSGQRRTKRRSGGNGRRSSNGEGRNGRSSEAKANSPEPDVSGEFAGLPPSIVGGKPRAEKSGGKDADASEGGDDVAQDEAIAS